MKRKLLAIALAVVMAVSLLFPAVALAADPTVTITVSAVVVSITNTEDTWDIGPVLVDAVVYFSATGAQDDDYSQIENTGNVSVDIEIQGTTADDEFGAEYDWTLSADGTGGVETYGLLANSEGAPTVYDIPIKPSSYVDLTTDLTATDTYDWSVKFTAPSSFDVADAGGDKTATITLVASQH